LTLMETVSLASTSFLSWCASPIFSSMPCPYIYIQFICSRSSA
jgi:hypothetical protein